MTRLKQMAAACLAGLLVACAPPSTVVTEQTATAATAATPTAASATAAVPAPPGKLPCRFYERDLFLRAMSAPKVYPSDSGRLVGGMIPHHLVASDMIAGFFSLAAKEPEPYDAVLIVSPSHFPENHKGHIATALAGWETPYGEVECAETLVKSILNAKGFSAEESPAALEADHGAAGLLPFVRYYLPDTPAACVLVSNRLPRRELAAFWETIAGLCAESNVLLIASVDCSHYLSKTEAADRDAETQQAVAAADFERILRFDDRNIDSPQGVTTLLQAAQRQNAELVLLDRASSADKLPYSDSNPIYNEGVTSYHVYAAREKPPESKEALIAITGDIMLHEEQIRAAYDSSTGDYDFWPAFEAIAGEISSADFAVANLETVLAGAEAGYETAFLQGDIPRFNAPDSLAAALKDAGFDLLTTANNHCLDHGEAGLLRTIERLETAGLAHTGTFSAPDTRKPLICDINGIRVAFVAFTQNTNGINPPPEKPWLISDLTKANIAATLNAAKAEKPDYIIALPHMGVEYEEEPRPEFVALAELLLAYGADAVLAAHPHVVQPMKNNGGFVAYSLGNFISAQTQPPRDRGVIVKLRLRKSGENRAKLVSAETVHTQVRLRKGHRVVGVVGGLSGQ